jgi:hypothetical protein
MKVTKLEAAKRQLVTAVDLFFLSDDPISVHTLTSASAQIIDDIAKSRNFPTLTEDLLLKMVYDDKRDYVRTKLREPRNFFKHAEDDPDGELEFNPDFNDMHLFFTCSSYSLLTGERLPKLVLFEVWFSVNNPHLLLDNHPFKKAILDIQGDAKMPKRDYYKQVLPLAMQVAAMQPTG